MSPLPGTGHFSARYHFDTMPWENTTLKALLMSTQQTPLSMALSQSKAEERATPLTAFRMARRWWLEGRRLNLSLLAEELGIGRATLMRWVGNKDLLIDRKSTRLNSSHVKISYAVFCLKKKTR